MKVVVTAQGTDLDSMSSPVFGRCPALVIIDTETMEHEGIANPGVAAGSGAGIQAAQFVIDRGVQAVLSHDVGPNAFAVLEAAGVPVYRIDRGTVRQAVEAFVAGTLPHLDSSTTGTHRGFGHRGAGGPGSGAGPRAGW